MREFSAPPWDAPLDVSACIAAIPDSATIKGMFILPMIVEARRRHVTLKAARDRYVPFVDYPLAEHARLLVETAEAFYPELSMRQGLRKLGRSAHAALVETVLGRVVWAGVDDVAGALDSVAKAYAICSSCTQMRIVEQAAGYAEVRLDGMYTFLDSHHVGVFEAVMRACNVKVDVAVRLDSRSSGEFLLTWALPR